MTDHDRERFARLMHGLETVYAARPSGQRFTLYFQALRALHIDTVEIAVAKWAEVGTRMPTPGDIAKQAREMRRAAGGGVPRLEGPTEPTKHGREAMALVRRIIGERLGPAQRLGAFKAMATRWPGVGWEEAVARTQSLMETGAARKCV